MVDESKDECAGKYNNSMYLEWKLYQKTFEKHRTTVTNKWNSVCLRRYNILIFIHLVWQNNTDMGTISKIVDE